MNIFTNVSTKHRLLINMIIAQIGFAAITIVAILSDSKIGAIVTINIVFALIISYTTWQHILELRVVSIGLKNIWKI